MPPKAESPKTEPYHDIMEKVGETWEKIRAQMMKTSTNVAKEHQGKVVEAFFVALDLTCKSINKDTEWEKKSAYEQAAHFKDLIANNVHNLMDSINIGDKGNQIGKKLADNIRSIDNKVEQLADKSINIMIDTLKTMPPAYDRILSGVFFKAHLDTTKDMVENKEWTSKPLKEQLDHFKQTLAAKVQKNIEAIKVDKVVDKDQLKNIGKNVSEKISNIVTELCNHEAEKATEAERKSKSANGSFVTKALKFVGSIISSVTQSAGKSADKQSHVNKVKEQRERPTNGISM